MSTLSNRGVPGESKRVGHLFCRTRLCNPHRFMIFAPQPRVRMNDLGGRVIFGIADDRDSASTGSTSSRSARSPRVVLPLDENQDEFRE